MNEQAVLSIITFILGCCLGSFLSVAIQRLLNGRKGIITGRSQCPQCKHQLAPLDLIPIFSWIFKKGQCSYCHKQISPIYPILEILTGLLFLDNLNILLSTRSNLSWNNIWTDPSFWLLLIYFHLLSINLLAICFSDIQKKAIPNLFLYSWLGLSLPGFLISSGPGMAPQPLAHLLGLLAGLGFFGGQYLISRGRWIGSGDIYFAAGMGLLLGLNKFILATVLSYIIGSIIVIILLLAGKTKAKQTIAFTPFLIIGTLIAFYSGQEIIQWYLNLAI